jgi:uridine kinase
MKFNSFVIGISGGSGSGKTSFVRHLKSRFEKADVCFISQDMYYKPREEQKRDLLGVKNFDRPESIDRSMFHKDVLNLLRGHQITKHEYTFNNELRTAKTLTFKPGKVVVIEGLFILHYQEIRELLDLSIFIHAKEELKVIRRISRDRQERNYPLDDVLYRYEKHVSPSYEKYIAPYRESVDVIINNNDHFLNGLMLVEAFVEKLLK